MTWHMEPPRKMPWMDEAACIDRDPEEFFPHHHNGMRPGDLDALIEAAKDTCRGCKAIRQCTEYALAMQPTDGIWAAMEPHEIANLRRSRTRSR